MVLTSLGRTLARCPLIPFPYAPLKPLRFVHALSLSPPPLSQRKLHSFKSLSLSSLCGVVVVVGKAMVGHQYQYHHWIERGDLLKANARFLQLQLRRRFRVAVDRHLYRRRDASEGGHFFDVIKRWIHRFRDFRHHTIASSSPKFSRKRVAKDIYAEEESAITRMLQTLAVPILGNVCHVFMHGLNRVQIYGAEKLHKALRDRSKDKPLITVSNHVASMDDPLVIASLLPPRVLMDAQQLRWTLCASDRCFKNPVTSAFFRSVKVLPVSRGDGIYQKGLDMAISKLNNGGWVHIFPEGSRSRDGGRTIGSAKRGVGRYMGSGQFGGRTGERDRSLSGSSVTMGTCTKSTALGKRSTKELELVLDADNIPVVVPFVHAGMQEIMPIGANVPRIGKIVTVLVGDPIEFDDLLNAEGSDLASRGSLYDAVSSRIGQRLQELKAQVDKLALEHSSRMKQFAAQSMDRAAGILQQVDWESFGMKNYVMSNDDSASSNQGHAEEEVTLSHQQQSILDQYKTTRFTDEGGIKSRIRSIGDPNELMGFAARSILPNQSKDASQNFHQLNPLRVWKQYLEANCGTRVQLC
ncbi:hypothetical protein Cgig2_015188 [Carnegiea gigantea]|uniref:Phospholipid/glycerol acyltransferase domain-containing protein n=1 Tax=Carnegiea gigantea TaxID=171969 RepID=A0A9Q1QPQ3_9CARY|nr:hypothetical protein Cgig2_015188 [Carnegiea gigantea]